MIKPQLVYLTPNAKGFAFYKDFIIVQMLKAYGCHIVCHYHNKGIKARQDKWLDNQFYRCFFKGIKVILLSDSLYEDVRKYVKRENVYICPNGIPEFVVDEFPYQGNVVPRLLFLSNLLRDKGVLVLLDSLKILKDKGYSFICDFVGGETTEIDTAIFEAEVNKRSLNNIAVYCGRKYGKEKQEAFKNADIFVFPTYYDNECFPLVLLEAMQHALPCISTKEGAIPDIIEDGITGYLVEKQNASQLANKIATLIIGRELCYKMGKVGREKYKREFTLLRLEERFVGILNKFVN